MKATLFALFTVILMVGCGSPDLDDPETLDQIIAEAIDQDKIQVRSKKGEELYYAHNKQTPYTGWSKQMYDNGQIFFLYQWKDGKQYERISWYKNGQKREERKYKDGKLMSMSAEVWKPDGEKCSETNLKNGTGVVFFYHEYGWKQWEETYKDGKRNGLVTHWYENGQKHWEVNYKDGKKDEVETCWHENGQLKSEINYKEGKLDGLWTGWYENGQKYLEKNYKDGKQDGLETLWTETGLKHWKVNYKDGKMNGLKTYWYEGGRGFMQKYKDGEQIGEAKYFDY